MSHPQPPQRQPTPDETQQYAKVLHNTALIALVACPVLAILPPRKLDVYTFGLGGSTLLSANYLVRERTGRSIWQNVNGSGSDRISQASASMQQSTVPPTEQANLNKELQYAKQETQRVRGEDDNDDGPVTAEIKNQREGWKAQREREIKEDVEEGKSFQDMIVDQIWEVWNWGKPKDEDE